jgi:hypothetical protein
MPCESHGIVGDDDSGKNGFSRPSILDRANHLKGFVLHQVFSGAKIEPTVRRKSVRVDTFSRTEIEVPAGTHEGWSTWCLNELLMDR